MCKIFSRKVGFNVSSAILRYFESNPPYNNEGGVQYAFLLAI